MAAAIQPFPVPGLSMWMNRRAGTDTMPEFLEHPCNRTACSIMTMPPDHRRTGHAPAEDLCFSRWFSGLFGPKLSLASAFDHDPNRSRLGAPHHEFSP